jgi:hypothetical protein
MMLTTGVVFENVSVYGMGGVKHFVKTFPDAFVDFVNVYGTMAGLFGKKSGTETAILHDFSGIVKPGEVFDNYDYTNNRCYSFSDNPTVAVQHVCEPLQINVADTPALRARCHTAESTPKPSLNTFAAKQFTIKKTTFIIQHSKLAKFFRLPLTRKLLVDE